MERYKDKKVVIIGGTSGMGLATAKMLLTGGARVVVKRGLGTRCVARSCAPNKPRPLSLSPNKQQANKHLVG